MEIRVFDRTAEMNMDEVMTNVPEVRIIAIRLGVSSRDLARKASKLIVRRMDTLYRRR